MLCNTKYKVALRGLKTATMLKEVARVQGETSRQWNCRALSETIAMVGRFVRSFGRLDDVAANLVLGAFAQWAAASWPKWLET